MKNNLHHLWTFPTNFLNIKTCVLGAICLFLFNILHAQIQKGTSSFEGAMKAERLKRSDDKATDSELYLMPSCGRFLTGHIQAQITLLTQINNHNARANDYFRETKLSVGGRFRYYFNLQAKWQFFAGASANCTKNFISLSYDTFDIKGALFKSQVGLSLGFDKFLNQEIALETVVNYDFLASKRRNNSILYSYGLNIKLNNFINFTSKINESDDLIAKGRKVINGKFSFNQFVYSDNFRDSYSLLNAEYGQFVAYGLLIGMRGRTNFQTSNEITAYAQYFYPISNRLMAQGKVEMGYIRYIKNYWSNGDPIIYNAGLGLAYFISKNVAAQFDILNYNKSGGLEGNFKGVNTQLRLLLFFK